MKKLFILLFLSFILIAAKPIEKGNPTATYYYQLILINYTERYMLNEYKTYLFINGTIIPDYEIIIKNNRSLVPVRLISEEFGANVEWDKTNRKVTINKEEKNFIFKINENTALVNGKEIALDYPAIIYNNYTYVPLRFIAENFDLNVNYSPKFSTKYTYYYDTKLPLSPANAIIRSYPNIIIDEKYDTTKAISKDEAMKKAKELCLKGFDEFQLTTTKNYWLEGLDIKELDSQFKNIQKEINRILYVGEVSRYYKFTIGHYDILYDKFNSKMFFVVHKPDINYIVIKEFDVNDPYLYFPVFIGS